MNRLPARFVLASALLFSGCEILGPVACTTEARAGLRVAVLGAPAGAPVDGALVVVRDGTYADSARVGGPAGTNPVALAHERAGVYDVTVEATGYHEYGPRQVRVREGECHVITEEVIATLQPRE